ncbi:MAG: EamA family transporter [Pirellulales bacterium]
MFNLLVLIAAMLYALSALLIKRASELGAGSLRTLVVSNIACCLVFMPLIVLGGTIHLELWWQPVIVAACFLTGQWFTFLSLQKGDVSVATPVLSCKIIMVALFITLLTQDTVKPLLWVAAVLASVGVAVLSRRPSAEHHHMGQTIITSLLGAASFALFDVLVQKWASQWGLGYFLPLTVTIAAIASLMFLPRLEPIPSEHKRETWTWLLSGAFVISLQSVLIVASIAYWQNAAQANVIYSSRGLWSIALIWLCGHWFHSKEQQLGRNVLGWRFFGALLMMLAILLAIFT